MSSSGESLARLAERVGGRVEGGDGGDVTVVDVIHDSRGVVPNSLFVAVRGAGHDGHDFVVDAVAAGAVAVCAERPLDVAVPVLVVPDSRAAMGVLAAEVHGRPSERLDVVGVTGTNGKTSVTYAIEAIAARAGRTPGVIGTIVTRVGGEALPTVRTTPEATDFQRLLRAMADRGADLVAAEVSSHALALRRVEGTRFAVAAFTNLSQDHLDFHRDMESYFAAKAALFEPERSAAAVVWVDDPHGARLAGRVRIPVTTVGVSSPADVSAAVLSSGLEGSVVDLSLPGAPPRRVTIPLPGPYAVANALVAAGCALGARIDPEAVTVALGELPPVPGRFEVVSGDDPVTVVVDYAHTPAGIEGVVRAGRRLAPGRVIALVGAGGDRDRSKRPAMGRAASAADVVVVTSDNPRSEDPEEIVDAVLSGVGRGDGVLRIVDRREAIAAALGAARPGDLVLLLGRGHEPVQEVADAALPFDDREVAREELAGLRGRVT